MTVRMKRYLTGVLFVLAVAALGLTTTGCSTEPNPPYPGAEFEFAGPYAVLGFGFDDQGRFFQQRSLVQVDGDTGLTTGEYIHRDGGTTVQSGDVDVTCVVETSGNLTVVPAVGAVGLGRSLLAPPPSVVGGTAVGTAALLGGPATLQGYVHQPTGDVAFAADFESLQYQELQVFLRRPATASYDQDDYAGRWGLATMYRYDGAFVSLVGVADLNTAGGLDYFQNVWNNPDNPAEPGVQVGTHPAGYWSVDGDGFVTYGTTYRGWVCGNNGAYIWDSIERTSTPDMTSPALAIRMDTATNYQTEALDGNYIYCSVIVTDEGARTVTGGTITFDPAYSSYQIVGRQNVRGQGANQNVQVSGSYAVGADGALTLTRGGTEMMRGWVGARTDGVASRAVGAKLTTAGQYGVYFIGR